MKKILFLSSLALTLITASVQAQTATGNTYGAPFVSETVLSAGRISSLMNGKESLEHIQLVGYVGSVCQKEGCWLTLQQGERSLEGVLVKIKDHAFKVPKDLAGKRIIVNGTVVKKMQSVAEQKHQLEDAGAPKDDITAINSPKEIYEMQATGVKEFR